MNFLLITMRKGVRLVCTNLTPFQFVSRGWNTVKQSNINPHMQ